MKYPSDNRPLKYLIVAGIYMLFLFSCEGQSTNSPTLHIKRPTPIGKQVSALCDSIIMIYQDSKKQYWFATYGHGVYRFDGKQLIQYTTQDGLGSNVVVRIQEDKAGRIYFDTRQGIQVMEGNKLKPLLADTINDPGIFDPSNDLWFGGAWNQSCLLRYDGHAFHRLAIPSNPYGDSVQHAYPGMSFSPYDIYSYYTDKEGRLWIGTSNAGVYCYNNQSMHWFYEDHLTNTPEGGSFGIRSIVEDDSGYMWFCNPAFKYRIEKEQAHTNAPMRYTRVQGIPDDQQKAGLSSIYFLSCLMDAEGRFWMLTFDDGIWCYDGKNMKSYSMLEHGKPIKLYAINQDKQGRLWVATHESGAWYFTGSEFKKFYPTQFR